MSGLFGIGGGVVVIPALSMVFLHHADIPNQYLMQMAVGTSLAIMIITSLSALYAHHKRQTVRWFIAKLMLPGLIIGSIVGALIAHLLSSSFLQILFAIFLIIMGLRLLLLAQDPNVSGALPLWVVRSVSLFIGILSSLLGIGGGALIVPFLLRCQLDMREAAGTSVVCGLVIGIIATLSFMILGLFSRQSIAGSTGYIYWPAFFGVAVMSILFAPIGAILAHRLPTELLKRIFGVFLLLMACDMLWLK